MKYSVFAMELALSYDAQSTSRPELRRLILQHPEHASYDDKARFYRQLSQVLMVELPAVERGCWDYFDNEIALDKYNEWCGGMLNEEGVRKTPSVLGERGPYRNAGEVRYMTFTMAFLLVRGSNTDRTLAGRCNVPQGNLWRRDVFASLLLGVNAFNFSSVRSDVVYMIPNRDDYGLTVEDLQAEKFKYLRTVV